MFYFAWVDDGATTFGVEHHVMDEDIYAFRLQQKENGFATLELEIRNPSVGLLSAGRKQWAWFSQIQPNTSVLALFHGRIIAVPDDVNKDIITITLQARPEDFEEQKVALAQTLKVAPYYDPIWFDPKELDNPDSVLEGRTSLYHTHRTTKVVSVSDILAGEAGTLTFDEDQIYEDSISIRPGTPPHRSIEIIGTVDWKQSGKGIVDLKVPLLEAFEDAGSDSGKITSFTGQGLESDWPQSGQDIGGGWTVAASNLFLMSGDGVTPDFAVVPIDSSILPPDELPEDDADPITQVHFFRWVFACVDFLMAYSASRDRKETVHFTLAGDVQDISNEADTAPSEPVTFTSSEIASPVDAGLLPIGTLRRPSYFNTERGKRSLAWLICYARAKLIQGARCVEVSAGVPYYDAVALSCRHSVTLNDPSLPGGTATGKVVDYALELNGDDGTLTANLTIACAIGKGSAAPSAVEGEPDYADDYDDDYEEEIGESPIVVDVTYEDFSMPVVDDGLFLEDMTPDNVIAGLRAAGDYSITITPSDGATVTIGSRTYTWESDPDDLGIGDVLIGTTPEESIDHLITAVMAVDNFAGFYYGEGTVAHESVQAETGTKPDADTKLIPDPLKMHVIARQFGTAGNSIATTASSGTWGAATLTGGAPLGTGLRVINGEDDQRDELAITRGSVQGAINGLNAVFTEVEMALVPVDGGPFEASFDVVVSDLVIPKMIDLEAG